jgi:hypothetical protein
LNIIAFFDGLFCSEVLYFDANDQVFRRSVLMQATGFLRGYLFVHRDCLIHGVVLTSKWCSPLVVLFSSNISNISSNIGDNSDTLVTSVTSSTST